MFHRLHVSRPAATAAAGLTLAALLTSPTPSAAAETSLLAPDADWGLVIEPTRLTDSSLARQFAAKLNEGQRDQAGELIDHVSNMVGIDLREDLGTVIAFGDGFEPGDVSVAVDVGPNPTNLEGLMLADGAYQSYEYGDLIVHSVRGEPENPRVYVAVLPGAEGASGVALMSPNQERTEALIDAARGGAAVAPDAALPGDVFFRMWVNRLPDQLRQGQGQGSNVLNMIRSMELAGATDVDETTLGLELRMTSPARARQVHQLAEGGKAMLELAADSDPDAAMLNKLLAYVSVQGPDQGGDTLTLSVRCDNDDLASLLDLLDEAGAFDDLNLD
ncbi:MAG: hypothetical protein AAF710_04285 [Planctomycetota bacterium]